MQTCQELELVDRQLFWWDTKFMIQLPNCSVLNPRDCPLCDILRHVHLRWFHPMKWMRAACVGPYLSNHIQIFEKQKLSEPFALVA